MTSEVVISKEETPSTATKLWWTTLLISTLQWSNRISQWDSAVSINWPINNANWLRLTTIKSWESAQSMKRIQNLSRVDLEGPIPTKRKQVRKLPPRRSMTQIAKEPVITIRFITWYSRNKMASKRPRNSWVLPPKKIKCDLILNL